MKCYRPRVIKEGKTTHPTGGIRRTRDYAAPTWVTSTYQTQRGTSTRDWNTARWVTKDCETLQTLPDFNTCVWKAPHSKYKRRDPCHCNRNKNLSNNRNFSIENKTLSRSQ